MSSMYIKWMIFSCDLLSLYPDVHFLSMYLSGIIVITNNIGDSASPWNIPLWIFASAQLFSPAVNSTFSGFGCFLDKVWFCLIFCTFGSSLFFFNFSFISTCSIMSAHFFVFNWLQFTSTCCLFPIGYLPKPTSMGGRICHHSPSSTTSIDHGDIPVITLLILSSAGWSCQQHPPIQ